MCDKAFNKCFLVFIQIPDHYESQEVCYSFISEDPSAIRYVPDQYKTHQMCDEAVDDSLAALKFFPDWLVTSKMIKKLVTALYADDNIIYFNEDSGDVIFPCNEMGILIVDLTNIDLDYTNYDEGDPEMIVHVRLMAWYNKFEKY